MEDSHCLYVLDALAESTAVDAAYIASPNAFHYSQSKRMLAGGKHVLCEKPIVTAPEQFDELCAFAAEKGPRLYGGDYDALPACTENPAQGNGADSADFRRAL